jgi:two-component system cell cycle sensor histidine kinase/response regulator CckA
MADGGELVFSTELRMLDEVYCRRLPYELAPGPYCMVAVSDSGVGMDAETQKHLFEPFFTTKEKGKGTGMGLPAVYGIVKVHKGAIDVYSEPGHGTTVKIFLPAAGGAAGARNRTAPVQTAARTSPHGLRILLVDDEESFREMAAELLVSLGHTVVQCGNGAEALDRYRASWRSTDLVVLDMIMPELGGRDTFIAMRGINPEVKAILSSGYSINGEAEQILREGVLGFIQKPFTTAALAELIAGVMSRKQ